MPACKFYKGLLTGTLAVFISSFLFAQSIEMPSMPEMPDMPSVSNPTLGGSFYKPSMPAHGTPQKNEENTNSSSNINTSVLKDGTTTDSIMSSFLASNSNLTASDISSLYDSGLFSNLSSLTNLVGNSSTASETETAVLLKQVLQSLEELKNAQSTASAAEKQVLSNYQQDAETFKKREPTILRFKINGYSVTESFSKVFFSEPEADGSFLLTADRRYYANQKPREETIYILFNAVKSTGSSVQYDVKPSIVQTSKNDQSFLYKLTQVKSLTAEKTGNLVVMHIDGDTSVDLLLDIDI